MDERDFNKFLGAVLDHRGGQEFNNVVDKMFELLDEADMDDYFGSEGWRHLLGWD